MEISEILRHFERFHGRFERSAVAAAVANRDAVIPQLLRILEDTVDHAAERDAEGGYMAHLYAMFLLAQFREVRAFPLVVRFASLPSRLLDSLCGDFLTQDLGRVLASVSGGDTGPIHRLIENPEASEWARAAAIASLATLVASGGIDRAEVVTYFASLFRGKLARHPSAVWSALVDDATGLYPAELFADIQQAYSEGLVDASMISLEDVQRDLAAGLDAALARLAERPARQLVVNTEREMGWWSCFGEERPKQSMTPQIAPTLKRITPKVGRNDPCPCGSGKKYKKCCGA